jgi:DNA-binding NarL/FixJ family response regulator
VYNSVVRLVKRAIAGWSDQNKDGESPGPETEVRPGHALSDTALEGKPTKTRVLVVEDHAFVRHALVVLINGQADLVCCGEADTITAAASMVVKENPALVLLDLRLKDGEALDLIATLRLRWPGLFILVLSQCDEKLYAEKVLRAGANGFLMKQEVADGVLSAVRTVLSGRFYLSPAMSARLGSQASDLHSAVQPAPSTSPKAILGPEFKSSL